MKWIARLAIGSVLPSMGAAAQEEAPTFPLPAPDWIAVDKFTAVQSVRELPAGLLISDRVEGLFFIGWETGRPRPIGRRGQGPREFLGAGPLFPLAADSTLLLDSHTGRWLLMSDTVFVGTVGEGSPLVQTFRTNLLGADELGQVMGRSSYWTPRPGRPLMAPDSVFLLLADRTTQEVDTVARFAGEAQEGATVVHIDGMDPRLVLNNPLASTDDGLLFPDGWVAVARHDPYRVDWRRPNGAWIRGDPISYEHTMVDRAQQCAVIERRFRGFIECRPGLFPAWPDELPAFGASSRSASPILFPGPDGVLIIHRTPDAHGPGFEYDMIDRRGRRIGAVVLGPGEHIVEVTPLSVYTVRVDAYDLQELRRRSLDRIEDYSKASSTHEDPIP